MMPETRFSSELDDVRELPAPLASAVRHNLQAREAIGLLLFKPAESAGGVASPPKTMAFTDHGFVFAEEVEGQPVRVVRCGFDDVLLVESAVLLLYGHLRVDYVVRGKRELVAMEYNAIAHELYRRAATLILEGASPHTLGTSTAGDVGEAIDLNAWPAPIRRAAEFGMLSDAPVYRAAWWPSVRGGFGHELAPAGAVLAREDRLTVVTLEQSGPFDRVRAEPTYGTIVTYLPAGRVAQVHTRPSVQITVFELEMHARHGGERFQIAVPNDHEAAVRSVIDDVLSRAGK